MAKDVILLGEWCRFPILACLAVGYVGHGQPPSPKSRLIPTARGATMLDIRCGRCERHRRLSVMRLRSGCSDGHHHTGADR